MDELLARPKPLGVLLYLALADGGGFQRRDALLALFWPESDTEHARSSLRQTLYQLRRDGAEFIVSRGEDVGFASGALWCDATEFQRRLALGDSAGALDLYRGELLPGFFVEGAPDFNRWLDERRRELRDAACSAASDLTEAAEQRGDTEGALAWSRRSVVVSPDDESSVRRLIVLLERTGDRTGALRIYEAFASRLREAYELEPGAETTELVRAIRRRAAAGASSDSMLDERRLLVTAFVNETGDPSLDWFGRLAADAIAQGVARLSGLQVVPLTAALVSARHVEATVAQSSGTERARLAAEETGAGTVVSGAYYADADELIVQGWIGNARTGRVLHGLGPARAPLASLGAAMEALREEACTSLATRFESRVMHVRAAARAPSYDAHRAYVEGIARFVDGDWREALAFFERAAASDAMYALPLIVSAIAHWNLGELSKSEAAVERAMRVVEGIEPFERAVLDMIRAWLDGDWAAAYDAVRRQAELAPGTIANFQVAEEARRRNRPREALRVLSSIDPARGEMRGWIFYWVVMAQALHMLGEHARELDVARRARALFPEAPLALGLEVHALAALGDATGVLRCLEERLSTPARPEPRPGTLMREAAHELRAHGHAGEPARALLQRSLAWYEDLPREERARPPVRRAIGRARYDVGDLDGAHAIFAELAGHRVAVSDCGAVHHPHLQGHLDHGYLGAIAVRRGDAAEAARIETLLEGERGRRLFGSAHYWRAAMAALRGDADTAVRLLRRALAAGMPYESFIHADPNFEALRDDARLTAVLAPRG